MSSVGSGATALGEDEVGDGKTACHECGKRYECVTMHWAKSDCSHPELTSHQKDVATGLLMGDGTVNRRGANPYIRVTMIIRPYLEYLDHVFGKHSNGVSFHISAEEQARGNRESGFSPNAQADNYSDQYSLHTISTPEFDFLAQWYDSGKKVFPDSIELTPAVLKHWFVCDGHYEPTYRYINISMGNEIDRRDNIERMFEDVGFEIGSWDIQEQRWNDNLQCRARFHVDETERLFDYMGDPLPGFEYKWPEHRR